MGTCLWFTTLILAWLLLAGAQSSPVPAPASAPARHAVFVSISLPGHLTPLLGEAEALWRRGWHVTVVTDDDGAEFVSAQLAAWPLPSAYLAAAAAQLDVGAAARRTFRSLGNLQDAANKRNINADAKLKELFGKPQVSMFELAGLIGKHVS